jgi:hypothetical protein
VPAEGSAEPPEQEYGPDSAAAISTKYGFDVVGPQHA